MNFYYTTDFDGHCPIGVAAVIVARDRGHALRLLKKKLFEGGLMANEKNKTLSKEIFQRLDPKKGSAIVLRDGNY